MERCSRAICLLAALWAGDLGAQHTEPFRTRNLTPLVAIFGLPSWEPAVTEDRGEIAVVAEMGSHFRVAEKGTERLVLDGETWRTSLYYRQKVGERWSVGLELPFYRHSGGFLDDPIDSWHSFFGLPDGNRNLRPEDLLEFDYSDQTGNLVFLSDSTSGLGDMQLSFGRTLGGDNGVFVRTVIKLPTGDVESLTSSGSADIAVTVFKQNTYMWRSHPAGLYWGFGAMYLGEPDFFAERSREWGALGLIGGSWQPFPRMGVKVQIDLNSPLYDSALDELGRAAAQASLGGWWAPSEGRVLEFAVIEDLIVRSSPDVGIHVGFRWDL